MNGFTRVFALVTVLLFTNHTWAQSEKTGPSIGDDSNRSQKSSGAPVGSINNFTESQAMSRIEDAGYSSVSGLKKDDNGVWRGKAVKRGVTTNVSVDLQGNVTARD